MLSNKSLAILHTLQLWLSMQISFAIDLADKLNLAELSVIDFMCELILISHNCFDIPERIREIDDDYRLFYNCKKNVIELHSLKCNPTFQLIMPFAQLDSRAVEFVRRTRMDKILSEIEQIDNFNQSLEQRLIDKTLDEIHTKTKSVVNYMNRGGSYIPSYSEL